MKAAISVTVAVVILIGSAVTQAQAPSGGYDGVAAAHSRGLARLSRDIADAIQAMARSGQ